MPRVQIDAAKVRDPGERGAIVADGKVDLVAAAELNMDCLEPGRMWPRDALLVEERAFSAAQ
jgi:hypothetical protein